MTKRAETQHSSYTSASMVSWLLGLAIRIPPSNANTQKAVAEVCSIWAEDLAEFSSLANADTLKGAIHKFKRWPPIADLAQFFSEIQAETRIQPGGHDDDGAALRNGLASKALGMWRLPTKGLGPWGEKCCWQWHLMQAVDAIQSGAILGGWDWSSGRCRPILHQTIDRPVEPDEVREVWMDEGMAFCEYMAGTGGRRG